MRSSNPGRTSLHADPVPGTLMPKHSPSLFCDVCQVHTRHIWAVQCLSITRGFDSRTQYSTSKAYAAPKKESVIAKAGRNDFMTRSGLR
ncbi:hypothetical protein B0H17DRAFT_13301 [Mycena rosella]|uniref:Uncharacterized protein n=1 Tax=Mycena rosella TaxID=1033263 RepID=A0AAD7GSU5_MYCRO|nr:hypothetical protein B0H17DRAFT_13301 [Mycena rosella]